MPRPGCVWSHVFLVELADLAGLADLGELRDHFRRPASGDEKIFSEPLRFIPIRGRAPGVSRGMEKDVTRFLDALYGAPGRPFVTEAPEARTYTDLVFALWSQQWPRLRRNFRFSTGSFTDRGRGGKAFDLQIAPLANYRAWQRTDTQLKPDNTVTPPGPSPSDQKWICAAADDLFSPETSEFRLFLHTNGADISDPRSAFAKLAAAYDELIKQPGGDWGEKLIFVGRIFPGASEAVRLKEWMTAPQELISSEQYLERSWATASFLLSARPEARAYASVSFDYARSAPLLWTAKRESVLSLIARLVRQPENPSAAAFVTAVADTIQPQDLRSICDERPELIVLFVRHRKSLAFETDTWQLPEHIQWRIFETLDGLSLDGQDWGKIMATMFLTATGVAVRDAVEKAGPHAIECAFRWLDSPLAQKYLPSQIWREALAIPAANRLADDEHLSPSRLALCAWLVPPKVARQTLTANREDVQRLSGQPLDTLPPPLRVPTAFLLVMLGLNAESPEGLRLLAKGFFQVHDALASNQYASESWSLLYPELPRSPWWKEWDRCEKLRRAVRKRLLHYPGKNPLLEIASGVAQREIANKILVNEIEDQEFVD
jgi:hypothetical protein